MSVFKEIPGFYKIIPLNVFRNTPGVVFDNLVVLHGTRFVDIYIKKYGRIKSFEVTPKKVAENGKVIYEGAAMLVWPRGVFHRIRSSDEGSSAINFAVHYEGIDMRTNFNIYDIDLNTGRFKVIREGFKDQQ